MCAQCCGASTPTSANPSWAPVLSDADPPEILPRSVSLLARRHEGARGVHRFSPWPIQAFGIHVSKIPAKHWRITTHAKNEGGRDWYRIAFATDGKDVVWAKYGTGPKGSFLVVLKTTVKFSVENPKALGAFADSITLD